MNHLLDFLGFVTGIAAVVIAWLAVPLIYVARVLLWPLQCCFGDGYVHPHKRTVDLMESIACDSSVSFKRQPMDKQTAVRVARALKGK